MGGKEKNCPSYHTQIACFDQILKKTWKFPNKKGTFDVNLVFTATLACTERELFITKKGTFPASQKRALLRPFSTSSVTYRNVSKQILNFKIS